MKRSGDISIQILWLINSLVCVSCTEFDVLPVTSVEMSLDNLMRRAGLDIDSSNSSHSNTTDHSLLQMAITQRLRSFQARMAERLGNQEKSELHRVKRYTGDIRSEFDVAFSISDELFGSSAQSITSSVDLMYIGTSIYILHSTEQTISLASFNSDVTSLNLLLQVQKENLIAKGFSSESASKTFIAFIKTCSNSDDQHFTTFFTFSSSTGQYSHFQFIYHKGCVTGFEFFEAYHKLFVIITTKTRPSHSMDESTVQLFWLSGSHFDCIDTRYDVMTPSGVCVNQIRDNTYIAVMESVHPELSQQKGSPVYKLYLDRVSNIYKLWRYQTLATNGGLECVIYEGASGSGGAPKHYLAIARHEEYLPHSATIVKQTKSEIYSFIGSSFNLVQVLATDGATNVAVSTSLEHCGTSTKTLLFITESSGLYTYLETCDSDGESVHGKQYELLETYFPDQVASSSQRGLVAFTANDNVYAVLASSELTDTLYTVSVNIGEKGDVQASKEVEITDSTITCWRNVQDRLISERSRLADLRAQLDRTLSKSLDQTIGRPFLLSGSVRVEVLSIENGVAVNQLVVPDSSNDGQVTTVDVNSVLASISQAEDGIQEIQTNILPRVITVTGDQPVTGTYIFPNGLTVTDSSTVNVISGTQSINDVLLSDPYENILYDGVEQIVNSPISIKSLNTGTVDLQGKLNTFETNELLLVTGDFTMNGNINFEDGFSSSSLTIAGTINGIVLGTDVVKTNEAQEIGGKKTILGQSTLSSAVTTEGLFQNVKLSDFGRDVAVIDQSTILAGSIVFANTVSMVNMDLTGLANNRDLVWLNTNCLDVNSDQRVTGSLTLAGSQNVLRGNLNIAGVLNNVDVNRDLLTTNTVQQNIFGVKILLNDASFTTLDVETINNIDILTQAVTRKGDNIILDRVVIRNDLHIAGEVLVSDLTTINNVDISEMARNSVMLDESAVIEGGITVASPGSLTASTLLLHSTVNNIIFEDMINNMWKINVDQDIKQLDVAGTVTINGNVDASKLTDGVDLRNDLVLASSLAGTNVLNGKKVISGSGRILGDIDLPDGVTINNMDISVMRQNVAIQGEEEVIHGIKSVAGIEVSNDVLASGKVCSISIPDELIVIRDSDGVQIMTGEFSISEVTADSLVAEDVIISGIVNGETDVGHMFDSAVLINEQADIDTIVQFAQPFTAGEVELSGTLHGVDWEQFTGDALRLSRNYVFSPASDTSAISGEQFNVIERITTFTVTGDLEFKSGLTSQTINGNPFTTSSIIFRDHVGPVRGIKHFAAGFDAKSLQTSSVNGESIPNLVASRLSKSTNQDILAPLIINGKMTVGSLQMNNGALLNTVNIDTIAKVNQETRFTQDVTFNGGIQIQGDVTIDGYLAGHDINLVNNNAIRINTGSTVKSALVFQSATFLASITADNINGVNIGILNDELVRTSSLAGAVVETNLVYEKGFQVANVNFVDVVNQVNIDDLYADGVTRGTTQTINGRLVIASQEGVHVRDVSVQGNLDISGELNGIALGWLCQNVILRTEDATITTEMVYTGNVHIAGSLKGDFTTNFRRIPEEAVLLHIAETLSYPLTIVSDLTSRGDITAGGLIDGVDIESLLDIIITKSGSQTLSGNIVMEDVYVDNDLSITGNINGIATADFVTKNSDHIITSPKLFESSISVDELFLNTVNANSIDDLWEGLVLTTETTSLSPPIVFAGSINFQQNVMVTGISSQDEYFDLSPISNFDENKWESDIAEINERQNNLDSVMDTQLSIVKEQYKLLWAFKVIQAIPTSDVTPLGVTVYEVVDATTSSSQLVVNVLVDNIVASKSPEGEEQQTKCPSFETIQYDVDDAGRWIDERVVADDGGIIYPFSIREHDVVIEVRSKSRSTGHGCDRTALPDDGTTVIVTNTLTGNKHTSEVLTENYIKDADIVYWQDALYMALAVHHDIEHSVSLPEVESEVICQSEEQTIECSHGSIHITTAYFGFSDTPDSCTVENEVGISCYVDVSKKVKYQCNGYTSCNIKSDRTLDKDGKCAEYFMVKQGLKVTYQCEAEVSTQSIVFKLSLAENTIDYTDWQLIQEIKTFSAESVRFFFTDDFDIETDEQSGKSQSLKLVLANSGEAPKSSELDKNKAFTSKSEIYVWSQDVDLDGKFHLYSTIKTQAVSDLVVIPTASTALIAFANEQTHATFGVPIVVYTYVPQVDRISEYQQIKLHGVADLHYFVFDDIIYLCAASPTARKAVIYRWYGDGKFQESLSIFFDGANGITSYHHHNQFYLVLSSIEGEIRVYQALVTGFGETDLDFIHVQ